MPWRNDTPGHYHQNISCPHLELIEPLPIKDQYDQYEVLNFADKLHIQYNIPFKLLSVSDTAKYIHKKHLNDEEPIYKA